MLTLLLADVCALSSHPMIRLGMLRIHPLACGLGRAYLIETPTGLFLVDSGSPGQEGRVLAKMKELGRDDLKLIWITHAHYDHYGSASALRELTGARIGVHPADAPTLSRAQSIIGTPHYYGFIFVLAHSLVIRARPLPATSPDFTLEDGETLERYGFDATILHTPGHTPGHTCLLLQDGTAFAGDLIASFPNSRLQFMLATDWTQLPTSLARLQAAAPKWIYTGHSKVPLPGSILAKITPRL